MKFLYYESLFKVGEIKSELTWKKVVVTFFFFIFFTRKKKKQHLWDVLT